MNQFRRDFERVGAILEGTHVVYTSGKHGSTYVNKDAIYLHAELTSRLCLRLAEQFVENPPEVVVSPALGAVILGQWVAFHLSRLLGREILSVYAEKSASGDGFDIKRGYEAHIPGKRCLIVEDILNTGGSALKVIQKVKGMGGEPIGIAVLCNRGGVGTEDLDRIPRLVSLVDVKFDAWTPEDCPLCKKGIPINRIK